MKALGLAVPNPRRNTARKLPVLILFIVPCDPEPIDMEAMMIARAHLVKSLVSICEVTSDENISALHRHCEDPTPSAS